MDQGTANYLSDMLSPSDEEIAREQHYAQMEASYDEYYRATEKVVMVPVKVRYHAPTNVVYGFTPPTNLDVENALKGG